MLRLLAFAPPLVTVLLATAPSSVWAGKAKNHHYPHMHHALHELIEAKAELMAAPHDFGGHRAEALLAIEAAGNQITLALQAAGDKVKVNPHAADVYKAYKHHPHIHHAIHELRESEHELRKAGHNFGGLREAALRDVQIAIRQLELALKFGRA